MKILLTFLALIISFSMNAQISTSGTNNAVKEQDEIIKKQDEKLAKLEQVIAKMNE